MKNYHVLVICGYVAILALILTILRAPVALRVGLWVVAAIWFAAVLRRIRTAPRS
jgi:hypothetical protein